MDPLVRILDANANRAREALRVMEDCARFSLNDAALAGAIKSCRHALREALDATGIDRSRLVANRDTPNDAGRANETPAEYAREGVRGIALAAAARLAESLRVLEEAAKAVHAAEGARAIERLRYGAYEVEKRLVLALGTGRARQWRLCVLVTESLCTHRPWREVARLAVAGGADCLQLREKRLDARELIDRARRLIEVARPSGVPVIVNDRADVALAADADGVHLGQTDARVEDVRAIAGDRLLVGVSTCDPAQARAAAGDGADYCGVGPMFTTATKEKPRIAGPAYLREYLADEQTARVPHLAIGGISPANIGELAGEGCRGVAVSAVVCSAREPGAVCRAILERLPG